MRHWLLFAAVIAIALPAAAETVTDTFDTPPVGEWTWLGPMSAIEDAGGNPGAWYHGWSMDTTAPKAITAPGNDSVFTGDLRAADVTAIGVDVVVAQGWSGGRPMSVLLINQNGTPDFTNDDFAAYALNDPVPEAGTGWTTFDWDLPAAATELPDGWQLFRFNGEDPAGLDWNEVVTQVDRVMFLFGDPTSYYVFGFWDAGIDNARITLGEGPVATDETTWGHMKSLFR